METWEIIKAISEDPSLVFKCIKATPVPPGTESDIGQTVSIVCNVLRWNGNIDDDFRFPVAQQYEWELVPQEVTWQKAIQAWVDGKTVYCELTADYSPVGLDSRFTYDGYVSESRYPLGKVEISKGKWYIK